MTCTVYSIDRSLPRQLIKPLLYLPLSLSCVFLPVQQSQSYMFCSKTRKWPKIHLVSMSGCWAFSTTRDFCNYTTFCTRRENIQKKIKNLLSLLSQHPLKVSLSDVKVNFPTVLLKGCFPQASVWSRHTAPATYLPKISSTECKKLTHKIPHMLLKHSYPQASLNHAFNSFPNMFRVICQ